MFGEESFFLLPKKHHYFVFASGTRFKAKAFNSRQEAEVAMYNYCAKHGIHLECTEYDKHERKYSNHNGVRFYINRTM